ncbi:MAG TPA: serine/threonine-protein kinase [Kofleriaceae bacterium]|nr:serine/threonine-protein kinase [Kofleriaceae bacterium]
MGGSILASDSQFAPEKGVPAGAGTRYQLLRRLAVGGMAEIFLARAVGSDQFAKTVVLKRLLPQLCDDDEYVAMFLHEARLCASLHHPNIAQVYDLGRAGQSYFFAMEYVHGNTLRQLLGAAQKAGIQVPFDTIVSIAVAVASGLHYAHEKRAPDGRSLAIVHRDITPSNVLIRYDGGVKLVDFGIAKAATSELSTRAGTLKGKLAYMSPEQALGLKVDRRSDIFSLGILLYELATVSRLFRADDEAATYRKLVEVNVAPPSSVRADFPAELERIIMKTLARPAGGRYQTGEELALDLERFAVGERLAVSPRAVARFSRELFGEAPPEIGDVSDSDEGIALWHDAPGKNLAAGSRSESSSMVVADPAIRSEGPAAAPVAAAPAGAAAVAVPAAAKKPRRKRRRMVIPGILVLAGILAFDAYLWLGKGGGLGTDENAPAMDAAGLSPAVVNGKMAVDAAPALDAVPVGARALVPADAGVAPDAAAADSDAASADAGPTEAEVERQKRREQRRKKRRERARREAGDEQPAAATEAKEPAPTGEAPAAAGDDSKPGKAAHEPTKPPKDTDDNVDTLFLPD